MVSVIIAFQKKIRSYITYGLIFFAFSVVLSCTQKNDNEQVNIGWKDKKAVSVSFPAKMAGKFPDDSISRLFQVRLKNQTVAILGEFLAEGENIVFNPLIPFTRGLTYEVWFRNQRFTAFEVPKTNTRDAPSVLAIYPSIDSLPENLLKIYLHFSRPVREGVSARYVTLLKNDTDTVSGAFLDLQPELWNPDRTILTLWLDPGRIKRDLQPNKLQGAPLQKDMQYKILVSPEWQDTDGGKLPKSYTKSFVTIVRDSLSPEPKNWKFSTLYAESAEPLKIEFGEALDHALLEETLKIQNVQGVRIAGKWEIGKNEQGVLFVPKEKWAAGKYKLLVESRLEDLAGNNLNRPFDRDITGKAFKADTADYKEVLFNVKEQ